MVSNSVRSIQDLKYLSEYWLDFTNKLFKDKSFSNCTISCASNSKCRWQLLTKRDVSEVKCVGFVPEGPYLQFQIHLQEVLEDRWKSWEEQWQDAIHERVAFAALGTRRAVRSAARAIDRGAATRASGADATPVQPPAHASSTVLDVRIRERNIPKYYADPSV